MFAAEILLPLHPRLHYQENTEINNIQNCFGNLSAGKGSQQTH